MERPSTKENANLRPRNRTWEDGTTPPNSEIRPRTGETVYSRVAGQFDSPLKCPPLPYTNPTLPPLHPSVKPLITALPTATCQSKGDMTAKRNWNSHSKFSGKIDRHHAVSVPPSLLHFTNLKKTHPANENSAVTCYFSVYSRFRPSTCPPTGH